VPLAYPKISTIQFRCN